MANTIQLRRSATANAVPTTAQLALGELAINTYDGKLYLKKNDGTESIVEVGSVSSGLSVTSGSLSASGTSGVSFSGTGAISIGSSSSTTAITLGQSTATQTVNIASGANGYGAVVKTVNIGSSGLSGSTTNINIGSAVSGSVSNISINGFLVSPVLKSYSEHKIVNVLTTGTVTLDLSTSNVFQNTLTGNTTFAFSNPPANTKVFSFTIIVTQDATGGRTITWPASKKFAGGVSPPPTTAANAVDVWSVMTYDGGTSYIVSLSVKDAK